MFQEGMWLVVQGHNTVRVGLKMKGEKETECQLGTHDS